MKKTEQKYNIRLTKNQLSVVRRALEAFERAQLGQFKMTLEQIFEFEPDKEYRKNLKEVGWDEYNAMEQMLKTLIFNRESGIQQNHSYFGITGASESAKVAYEIQKVIDQFLYVEQNDGYWGLFRTCDDPLDISQEPIPEIVEFKKYKDYLIPEKEWKKIRDLFKKKEVNKLWELIEKYIPDNIDRGSKMEIYPFCQTIPQLDIDGEYLGDICLRIWKPRKKENDETE